MHNRTLAIALFVLFVPVLSGKVYGQRSEVGFGIVGFNYTGDLARTYSFANIKPGATVFYRSNLSSFVSFRAAISGGKLGASDRRPIDAFAQQRNASFNIFLYEASAVMEYHFLNWREPRRLLRLSPYMFGGLGLFGVSGARSNAEQYSTIQGAVPFGAGIKYVINPKWYIALEFGVRKTFFDHLDNISAGRPNNKNFQYGNPNDSDAYYLLSISLTHSFYEIPCPTNPYR